MGPREEHKHCPTGSNPPSSPHHHHLLMMVTEHAPCLRMWHQGFSLHVPTSWKWSLGRPVFSPSPPSLTCSSARGARGMTWGSQFRCRIGIPSPNSTQPLLPSDLQMPLNLRERYCSRWKNKVCETIRIKFKYKLARRKLTQGRHIAEAKARLCVPMCMLCVCGVYVCVCYVFVVCVCMCVCV